MMNATDPSSSGLRLIGNNRDLDPADCVYERRLANVGSTNKGYKSPMNSYRLLKNTTHGAKKNFQTQFSDCVVPMVTESDDTS